ncbi:hypothetical protein AB0D37_35115 [Streptomyces sp. NPDC048384]|uniref:hypothetical protein n=1 Tax=Streptomyces sp. NPDC048384 TaxID=3155487 RepID=UPI003430839E
MSVLVGAVLHTVGEFTLGQHEHVAVVPPGGQALDFLGQAVLELADGAVAADVADELLDEHEEFAVGSLRTLLELVEPVIGFLQLAELPMVQIQAVGGPEVVCVLANAATGCLPFGGGAPDAVAFRVMQADPDLDGVPAGLKRLVEQALAKEPTERPGAAELADECAELLAVQETAVLTPAGRPPTLIADLVRAHWDLTPEADSAWPTSPRRSSRTRLFLAVAVTAALLGSLGGALAAVSKPSDAARGQAPTPSRHTSSAAAAAQQSTTPRTAGPAAASGPAPAASPTPQPLAGVSSPAYTRSDNAQPSVDEWAKARLPDGPLPL